MTCKPEHATETKRGVETTYARASERTVERAYADEQRAQPEASPPKAAEAS